MRRQHALAHYQPGERRARPHANSPAGHWLDGRPRPALQHAGVPPRGTPSQRLPAGLHISRRQPPRAGHALRPGGHGPSTYPPAQLPQHRPLILPPPPLTYLTPPTHTHTPPALTYPPPTPPQPLILAPHHNPPTLCMMVVANLSRARRCHTAGAPATWMAPATARYHPTSQYYHPHHHITRLVCASSTTPPTKRHRSYSHA